MDRTLIELLTQGPIGTFLALVGAVFVVIAVIWAFRAMMRRTKGSEVKSEMQKTAASHTAPSISTKEAGEKMKKETFSPPVMSAEVTEGVSEEVVAVIMAAIAAMEGSADESSSGLVIRRIRRVTGNTTSWSSAGLRESIDHRML